MNMCRGIFICFCVCRVVYVCEGVIVVPCRCESKGLSSCVVSGGGSGWRRGGGE